MQLANSFGVQFMETSCKTGECVDEAFNELTQQIKDVVDRKVSGTIMLNSLTAR